MVISRTLYCPVCKGRLGISSRAQPFEALCDDCDFYYYFAPNALKPSKVTPRRVKENTCTCPTCRGRTEPNEG